jgi:MATE family multidrug resistance protein
MGAGRPQVAHRAAVSGVKNWDFLFDYNFNPFCFYSRNFSWVFAPDGFSSTFEAAVPVASNMIRIASLYVLAEAVMVALVGALRGAGDTFFTMMASVIAHWLFVPILYISLNVLHLSVELSWFLLVVFFLSFCSVLYFRFKSGKWKNIKVIG